MDQLICGRLNGFLCPRVKRYRSRSSMHLYASHTNMPGRMCCAPFFPAADWAIISFHPGFDVVFQRMGSFGKATLFDRLVSGGSRVPLQHSAQAERLSQRCGDIGVWTLVWLCSGWMQDCQTILVCLKTHVRKRTRFTVEQSKGTTYHWI